MKKIAQHIFQVLKSLFTLFTKRIKWVWFWILVSLIIIASFVYMSSDIVIGLIYSGVLFQLLGVSTIAWDISNRRRSLDKPIFEYIVKFIEEVKNIFKDRSRKKIEGGSESFTLVGKEVRFWVQKKKIQDRVDYLEKEVQNFFKEIDGITKDANINKKYIQQDLKTIRDKIDNLEKDLKKLVENVSLSGTHIEYMGFGWFLVGIPFATIPEFIIRIFSFCV